MGSAVSFQNIIVEMFHAQAEARYPDILQRLELRLSQRAGFALKGDFLGILPAHVPVKTFHQVVQLLLADVRRRPTTEVSEPKLPALKGARAAIDFVLSN